MSTEVEIDVNTLLGLLKTDLGETFVQARIDLVLARHEVRALRTQLDEQEQSHSRVVSGLIAEQQATTSATNPEVPNGP